MATVAEAISNRQSQQAEARDRLLFPRRGASLGLVSSETGTLIRQIEEGFAFATLESLAKHTSLDLPQLGSILRIPERTLARRKAAGRLSPDESERLLRIARVFELATALVEGDVDAALTWLTAPRLALGNRQPLLHARTELGAREVEELIGRLEYGVFS